MLKTNKRTVHQITLTFISFLLIMIFLFLFLRENDQRIIRQNERYLQDATERSSKHLEDIMHGAKISLNAISRMCGKIMESSGSQEIDIDTLLTLTDYSSFDYVVYMNKEGTALSPDGVITDVTHKDYFIEGMKGNSGVCAVLNSRMNNESLILFYAPVMCNGEITGVLNGVCRQGGIISNTMSASFFGVKSRTFLCKQDGTVIFFSGDDHAPANMLDSLNDYFSIQPQDSDSIRSAFARHASCSFTYKGSKGIGNACIVPLPYDNWVLLQTFPSIISDSMIDRADSAGIHLAAEFSLVFAVYLLYLLLSNRKQKKKLITENQEFSRIVSGITQLFQRFLVVDLEKDTYTYLEDPKNGMPIEGNYSQLVSKTASQIVFYEGEERPDFVIDNAYIQEHLTETTPYLQYEYQVNRGTETWENISILCLKRENKVPTAVLIAVQDVTHLKEQELQNRLALQNAFDAANAANQAKSDFLSRMSHDIRTPMNAIMGMTAVAVMHIEDKVRVMDCLSKITASSRHLLALINDVLDMSKIESGKITLSEEEFNMPEMVDGLMAIIQPQITAKKQELKIGISHIEHENVIGDTLHLRQIFVNIMGNAVKFTQEGGTIFFGIQEKPSHISGMGCFEFVFADNGIGMEEEFIDRIFEPFARSQNSKNHNIEGTGLGMPITKNIVQMMNGTIRVESKPGEGSKFTVQLYLRLQNVEKEHAPELADLKILVADDEKDACESACEILSSIGMEASWVLSGREAVREMVLAHENHTDFSAAILDWKMPGMDGVETARKIRKELGPSVPIIILSAYDWSAVEQEARTAGVSAFIEKPLFRSRLLYVLKSVMNTDQPNNTEVHQLQETVFTDKRILLVEDNELNREIGEELLTSAGIQVEIACDGQEAVELLKEKPEHYFHLIFMDIQMPRMNGYEAAAAIRRMGRPDLEQIPIVAMSADAFTDDIQRAKDVGMNDHVAKPVEIDKLLAALNKWL